MFNGKWSLVIKTAFGCLILFIPILILTLYMFTHQDYEGVSGVFAVIILILSLITFLIALAISFLISLLKISNKNDRVKVSSGQSSRGSKYFEGDFSLVVFILLMAVAILICFIRVSTYDPNAKREWERYQPDNQFNTWQASMNPAEVQSKSLK
jgi:hypothetical protein